MMSIKEMLTSKCAGIILREVKKKGRTTIISDECGVNRKYLNRKMLRMLRMHRMIGLLYCTATWMNRDDFRRLGSELFTEIWDTNNDFDGEL